MPVHRVIVAGRAAGFAVEQAVGAETNAHLRLAKNAELLAPAARFGLLTLGADDPAHAGLSRHGPSVGGLVGRKM